MEIADKNLRLSLYLLGSSCFGLLAYIFYLNGNEIEKAKKNILE